MHFKDITCDFVFRKDSKIDIGDGNDANIWTKDLPISLWEFSRKIKDLHGHVAEFKFDSIIDHFDGPFASIRVDLASGVKLSRYGRLVETRVIREIFKLKVLK